jgi:LPXTG-motif cell wall-anchored protein
MDALLEVMTGTVALALGGLAVMLLAGVFLLWRSRRKLRETT